MSRIRLFSILALMTLLSACAHGPTKLRLDPEVVTAGSSLGAGQTIQLRVSGGADADGQPATAKPFELERPAAVSVKEKLMKGLVSHQFQIGEAATDRQFVVVIQKAEHVINRAVLRDTIMVETAIQFSAVTPAGTRTRVFNDKRSREVGGTATLGEVSGELNQSLGHVLARALNDAELMAFLGQ